MANPGKHNPSEFEHRQRNDSEPLRKGVVAVIVRQRELLVIRRSQFVVAPLAYCFPGGGIEAGESEPEALRRELEEELSVTVEPIRCLWQSTTSWGVQLAWWYSKLSDPQKIQPNPAEVQAVHWLSVAAMLDLPELLESNLEFLSAIREGKISFDELHDS